MRPIQPTSAHALNSARYASRRSRRAAAGVAALIALSGVSCSLLGPEVDQLFDGADAGVDAAVACDPIKPPERPLVSDTSGPDRAYVLRDIVLDQSLDRWETLGFDLDDRCSLPPEPDVECLPPSGGNPETDGVRGIDNAFGHRVAPTLVGIAADLERDIREDQLSGTGGILLQLRGYNGEADDPSVDVFVAQTIYAIPQGATERGTPNWDGQDSWFLEDSAFDGAPDRPRVRNDNAYVRDHQLVVRLLDRTDITFNVGDGLVNFRFISASIVGRISGDGKTLDDVVLSGRWALSDLALTADELGLCKGSVEREFLDNSLANIADLRATPGTGGPGARCDAVSAGLGFTGYRGTFAGLAVTEDVPIACR